MPLPAHTQRPILQASPSRIWEPTGNFTDDGKPMFTSREWQVGERAAYYREVLYREPTAGDSK